MNHEVMPVGTREAMTAAAEQFRAYERHHEGEAHVSSSRPVQLGRLEKAKRNREHAERLEALLAQPSVERRGA